MNEYISEDAIVEQIKKNLLIKNVDNGIGSYEFWGQKCVDHQYENEIQSDNPVDVEIPGGFYDTITFQYELTTHGRNEDEEYNEDITVSATPIKNENGTTTFQLEIV